VPAGCTFWREAQNGRAFYTTPADHYNCAVGAYTHAIQLPMEREQELMDTVGFMVEANYLSMDEVPTIPKLSSTPAFIAYAPADAATFEPTVVVVAAKPASAMLLYEAAIAAGASNGLLASLGRPGCAVVPLTLGQSSVSMSLGCRGNRTFTGLEDDLLYVCVAGSKWSTVVDKLAQVAAANKTMGDHYLSKKEALAH
jgi:uncharacterized protein (DUF169 family)